MKSMLGYLKNFRNRFVQPINDKISNLETQMDVQLELLRLSIGRIEGRQTALLDSNNVNDYEFQVFSQWGEDGIIQYLVSKLSISNKVFVEFGADNYKEANTRYLLLNNNWSGLIIDNNADAIRRLKLDRIYWLYNIKALDDFITKENINEILQDNGINKDIGLLSIDIDGNDYWIWKAIEVISPYIVVIEYNYRFGTDTSVTIPYSKDFIRSKAHPSYVYYGASLRALVKLGHEKGYSLVGCNSNGVNAFFVRKDIKPLELIELSIEEAYRQGKFTELRDGLGNLIKSTPEEEMRLLESLELPLEFV